MATNPTINWLEHLPDDGQAHQVSATYDGAALHLYVDGQLV